MTETSQKFADALEENDISVDSTFSDAAGLSVMYAHEPGEKATEVATFAMLYAKAPTVAPATLTVTALTSTGRNAERVANFAIERADAEKYRSGELSKTEYVKRVLETWREY